MSMINKISKDSDFEDPRRDFLVRALTTGAFIATGSLGILQPAEAGLFGKRPQKMPPNKSVYSFTGNVRVNGKNVTEDTFITASDLIETGNDSSITFVVGKDAFILRNNSRLQLSGGNVFLDSMRLVTGKLLSVFGKRGANENKLSMRTVTATIGIRGTGVYAESDPDKSYLCTCYGVTDIVANNDEKSQVTVAASHHDAPKYILADGAKGKKIEAAPMINHTDLELILIEELVGRQPPFGIESREYKAPRRGY